MNFRRVTRRTSERNQPAQPAAAMFLRILAPIFICLAAFFTNFYPVYAENFQVTIPPGAATSIENEAFIPSTISVPINSTVMWTNNDTTPHTVTANNESDGSQLFDSGFLSPGQTFEVTFDKTGNYHYQCMLHPFMRGNVMIGVSNTSTLESNTAELSNTTVTQGNEQIVVEQSPLILGAKKINDAYVWESNGRNNPTLNLISGNEYSVIVRSILGDPAEHELKIVLPSGEDILESEGVEEGEQTQLSFTLPGTPGILKYYCVYHPQSMVGIINVINNINSSDISGSMSNTSSSADDQSTFVDGRSGEDRDDADDDDDGDRRGRGRGGSEDNRNNRGPGSD